MNLNERISKVIEDSQLTPSEFADEIEVQRSSISHITSGRNKPSLDFLIKVKDKFPTLNWDWLIKGEGEMYFTEENNKIEKPKQQKPTSIPDLFSLIDDENFGHTESEDRIQSQTTQELKIPETNPSKNILNDSQRLGNEEKLNKLQMIDNQGNKIKRIVLFFENGKFESFEP